MFVEISTCFTNAICFWLLARFNRRKCNSVKNIIQQIFRGAIFKARNTEIREGGGSGSLGTHSVRKLAATHARQSGASKDERGTRGRWKGKARVGDRYDDMELPWPDVKVGQMLCIGGPCKYRIKRESGVSDAFVLQYVVPNLKSVLMMMLLSFLVLLYCIIFMRMIKIKYIM